MDKPHGLPDEPATFVAQGTHQELLETHQGYAWSLRQEQVDVFKDLPASDNAASGNSGSPISTSAGGAPENSAADAPSQIDIPPVLNNDSGKYSPCQKIAPN